jgi:hypothetical protein
MARHYSTRDFFRQTPNPLLSRYFQGRGVLGDLDFASIKDTEPAELFESWLSLFRKIVGMTPFDYLTNWRLGVAQTMLRKGNSLKVIAVAVGYTNARLSQRSSPSVSRCLLLSGSLVVRNTEIERMSANQRIHPTMSPSVLALEHSGAVNLGLAEQIKKLASE